MAIKRSVYKIMLLIFALSLCSPSLVSSQAGFSAWLEDALQSVVTIYSSNATESIVGSGFFISRNVIITNFHVVEDFYEGYYDRAWIETNNNESYYIQKILAVDIECDLAMVQVDLPRYVETKPLSLNVSLPKIGEEILVIGSPLELKGSVTRGIISSVRDGLWIETKEIQIDAAISSGSSGGPVLNTKGEVIGVAYAGIVGEGVESLNFAIPAERVYRLAGALYGMKDSDGDWVPDDYDFCPHGNGVVFCDITYYRGDGSHSGFRDQPDPFFIILFYMDEILEKGYYFESEVFNNTDLLEFPIYAELDIPDNIEDIWVNVWVYDFDPGKEEYDPIDIDGEYSEYYSALTSYYPMSNRVSYFNGNGADDGVRDEVDAEIRFEVGINC